MTDTLKKKRIFHIAKELNISHLEIIKFLESKGRSVQSHMAPVSAEIYDDILMEFSKDKEQSDRYRKEQARKKVVSNIRKNNSEELLEKEKPKVKKIKTQLSDHALSLSERLKKASKELEKEKEQNNHGDNESLKINKEISKTPKKTLVDDKNNVKKINLNDDVEKLKELSDELNDKKIKVPTKPRKLKKISIEDIADKINSTRKRPDKGQNEKSRVQVKQPLPQFGKTASKKKAKRKNKNEELVSQDIKSIKVPEFTTIDELAQSMDIPVQNVIKASIDLGMMVTINQRMDMDSIIMLADEFGYNVETINEYAEDQTVLVDTEEDLKNAKNRPPVVTIMGHVDHGKTSLLDYIRNTNVVAGESGGITQHIGAYEVQLSPDKKITFLDTPGHAAFTAMRARGAQVTDIVIVIVASDDDIMPQTVEAIDHAKAADVPILIAINKIDVPNSNPEKIKKGLAEINILVEEWGGKYQSQEISAKSGDGIDQLLEKILLEAEVLELKANYETDAKGIVIESRLDKGLGAIATVLITKGTLKKGEVFLCGNQFGKVRAMLNERNIKLDNAFPSDPIQILGFETVPKAGDSFTVFKDERDAKKIATERSHLAREAEQRRFRKITLDQIGKKISSGEVHELDIIIKGDVDGSIEALSDSLMDLSNEEVSVNIIHRAVGMIVESDVSLAQASRAIIVAFNVKTSPEANHLSRESGVEIRTYSIIYEAIKEVKLALEGLLTPDEVEEALGYAEVRQQFKIPKLGIIAGSYVTKGKVVRNAMLRVRRNDEIIHEGKLTSLKRFKDDANEVVENYECGIGVDGFYEFIEKDIIEVYEIKEIKRKLK